MTYRNLAIGLAMASASCAGANAQTVGESQLIAAAQDCRAQEAAALVARGIDVNAKNPAGYTPLMMAAGNGCAAVVRLLLDSGADAAISHASFGDAAAQAKMNRHSAIQAMIEGRATATRSTTAATGSATTPPARPKAAGPGSSGGSRGWPKPGRYQVGQQVLFSGTAGKTWDSGVIKSIDPVYGYNIEGSSGSYDPFFVVGAEREPFWTGYFIGDWKVSVPMAMGTVTDGRYIYRTVSGGMRLPPLRIGADGTYSWRVRQGKGEQLVRGRWEPNPKGPGVILKAAEKGADWLVYNNSRTDSALGQTVILSSDCCTYYDGTRLK
ncbi:ankyrin repeat domain-containing protein [Sphingomonas gilva]|uniref:Ankyrin repeat domain-containing protein n=1 Tax=Sphingomonas gilva TaxID=2305907 RepID=A0A396RLX7_9SPHN|nr:ankyrin repeat domain-containing protein [Sphingomonas gilva]RHW17394.1 ankyrin repeat domain-containing protein [Sphingomonas gilva]